MGKKVGICVLLHFVLQLNEGTGDFTPKQLQAKGEDN